MTLDATVLVATDGSLLGPWITHQPTGERRRRWEKAGADRGLAIIVGARGWRVWEDPDADCPIKEGKGGGEAGAAAAMVALSGYCKAVT